MRWIRSRHWRAQSTIWESSGIVENTPANMRRWVKNPQAIKPGALMPDFYLDDQQIEDLAGYVSSLR